MPDDLVYLTDPELPDGPAVISEQDQFDAELDELLGRNRYSRVYEIEWQAWHGVAHDAAEREMLRREAPAWVFLPPGGALAAALEQTRPEAMSPMALIELMKAADRLISFGEAIKTTATASFVRQRRAEHRSHRADRHATFSDEPVGQESCVRGHRQRREAHAHENSHADVKLHDRVGKAADHEPGGHDQSAERQHGEARSRE